MERHEEILKLFLEAFEAWGPKRDSDLAITVADEAIRAAVDLGDDPIGERVIRAATFLQGLAAVNASPGPIKRRGGKAGSSE